MARQSKSNLPRAAWAGLLSLVVMLAACQTTAPAETLGPPGTPAAATDWWQPEQGLRWQVQYTDEIDFSVEADIFDLDLFETTATQIADLHARGAKVVCYLNAGAWEDWRPDREAFPAEVIGADYAGWPGERWLDIRQIDTLAPILRARLDLCAAKGFDGVDPDNLDGHTNATGFPLTAADQLTFNRWLAEEAHQLGLGIGLKNDPEQAEVLVTSFDWAITESCFAEGWCDQLAPFLSTGKPVLAIEYTDRNQQMDDFCPAAADLEIDAILKHRNLDAWMEECP